MKLHIGDEIIVTIGKDKGKKGKIETILEKEGMAVVTDINQFKRHLKGNMQGQKSEIVTITKPMKQSKLALICPKCHKQTRIGYKLEKGKKVRMCKKCNAVIN